MTEIINGHMRMMGNRILLKPLEWDASRIIYAIRHGRPVRGEVMAVGPGSNPIKYKDGPKGKRSLMDYSKHFQRTELKVGDIVELGGLNVFDGKGYQFTDVLYNNEMCLICSENDVAIVRDDLKASISLLDRMANVGKPRSTPFQPMSMDSIIRAAAILDAERVPNRTVEELERIAPHIGIA